MLMSIVLLSALLVGITTLISAGDQWESRRKAASAAATMARAGAQGDVNLLRDGIGVIDPTGAQQRVGEVVAALNSADPTANYSGGIDRIETTSVVASATVSVDYTFPAPGFPSQVTGTASAEAVVGGS